MMGQNIINNMDQPQMNQNPQQTTNMQQQQIPNQQSIGRGAVSFVFGSQNNNQNM